MATDALQISIVTPERTVYQGQAQAIVMMTMAGEITVLPRHIPLVTALATGEVRIQYQDGTEASFAISRGVAEVRRNSEVVLLVDTGEAAKEIDPERAQAAYDRAREYLEQKNNIDDVEYARFQAMLERNLNRVKIAKKYRP